MSQFSPTSRWFSSICTGRRHFQSSGRDLVAHPGLRDAACRRSERKGDATPALPAPRRGLLRAVTCQAVTKYVPFPSLAGPIARRPPRASGLPLGRPPAQVSRASPPRGVPDAMPFRKGRRSPGSPQVRRPLSPRGFRLASSHPALAILPRVTPLRSALHPQVLHCPLQSRSVRGYTTWMREPPLGWEADSSVLVLQGSHCVPAPGCRQEHRTGNFRVCFWETWVILLA